MMQKEDIALGKTTDDGQNKAKEAENVDDTIEAEKVPETPQEVTNLSEISSNYPNTVLVDKYTDYYMLQEGNFLYYYAATVGTFAGAIIFIGLLIGSCMFNLGANAVLKLVEEAMKKADEQVKEMTARENGEQPNQPSDDFMRAHDQEAGGPFNAE